VHDRLVVILVGVVLVRGVVAVKATLRIISRLLLLLLAALIEQGVQVKHVQLVH